MLFTRSGKNSWALFLLILSGIVIGGFLGTYLEQFPYFSWLNFGLTFGINPPFQLDLNIISLTVGLNIKFTIAGVMGMAVAIFVYKKL